MGCPWWPLPKCQKWQKWGLGGPWGTHVAIGAMHGAGGAPTWAATNSNLGKFGKLGEFIDLSKFSFNELSHQNVGPNH